MAENRRERSTARLEVAIDIEHEDQILYFEIAAIVSGAPAAPKIALRVKLIT